MSNEIRFVGGPADGRTITASGDEPPWLYRIPLPTSIADLLAAPLEVGPIPVAEYEPVLSDGWPSRAGDGAYLYRHRAAPVPPEERARLEQARREARAAEAARAAELDETWREIREQRPHFPADWRDLF